MLRWSLLLVLLAGCTASPASVDDGPDAPGLDAPGPDAAMAGDVPALDAPVNLIFGDYDWNRPEPNGNGAIDQIEAAMQTVVPGCLDPSTGEPETWNLDLGASRGVPNGTGALDVTFTWDETAYIRDELVLAYLPVGSDEWLFSQYLPNGVTVRTDIDPEGWEGDSGQGGWRYVACLVREEHRNIDSGTAWRPGAFRGTLHVVIDAVA